MIALWLVGSLLFSSAPVPEPSSSPAALLAQEEEEVLADKREEVKALLAELAAHVKRKGKEDTEAVGAIDKLLQEFPNSGPKDRGAIVKGVAACFKAKRKDLEDDRPDNLLYGAAANALGLMGPESVKALMGLVGHKSHKSNLELQAALILSLGKTKELSGVKPLIDLLDDKDAEIQKAGAEALANYREAKQDVRKEIYKECMDIITALKSTVDNNPTDQIASERYNMIAGAFVALLQQVSGYDSNNPDDFTRWWNKNKKEDWDAIGG